MPPAQLNSILRGKTMKSNKKLQRKMLTVFGEEMHMLSAELQKILLDDLVTAFESRLDVMNRAQSTLEFKVAESVECETLKT
jgi:hypothetical protein